MVESPFIHGGLEETDKKPNRCFRHNRAKKRHHKRSRYIYSNVAVEYTLSGFLIFELTLRDLHIGNDIKVLELTTFLTEKWDFVKNNMFFSLLTTLNSLATIVRYERR